MAILLSWLARDGFEGQGYLSFSMDDYKNRAAHRIVRTRRGRLVIISMSLEISGWFISMERDICKSGQSLCKGVVPLLVVARNKLSLIILQKFLYVLVGDSIHPTNLRESDLLLSA